MLLNPEFRDMLCALHAEHAEFLVVGSYAVAAYAPARATEDIDIWVRASEENSHRVMQALLRFGAPTEHLSLADFQSPDQVLQMGAPPWRIDFMTYIEGVTFDEAWAERHEYTIDGVVLPVMSRHLLHNKRLAGRYNDLADVDSLERNADG
jgi:hypothetical protein